MVLCIVCAGHNIPSFIVLSAIILQINIVYRSRRTSHNSLVQGHVVLQVKKESLLIPVTILSGVVGTGDHLKL